MTAPRRVRLSVSSPSVNTRTTRRPSIPLQLVEARGDRVPEPRAVAEIEILDVADQLVAIVREVRADLDLVVERADARLVGRQQPEEELLGGLLEQRSIEPVMLPLVSSITTTVIGWTSFSK